MPIPAPLPHPIEDAVCYRLDDLLCKSPSDDGCEDCCLADGDLFHQRTIHSVNHVHISFLSRCGRAGFHYRIGYSVVCTLSLNQGAGAACRNRTCALLLYQLS